MTLKANTKEIYEICEAQMIKAQQEDAGYQQGARHAEMAKCFYVLIWCLEECDDEHRNIDIRTLDEQDLVALVAEALAAWKSGAR